MIRRLSFAVPVLAALSACSPSYSPNTYASNAMQKANKVERGVVVGVRRIDVSASATVGTVTGAAAGGLAGADATIGPAKAFAALGGSVVGGLAGAAVEHAAGDTHAYEYIVRETKDGLVSVTQKDKIPLSLGEHVLVITGAQARVVRDYTVNLPASTGTMAAKPSEHSTGSVPTGAASDATPSDGATSTGSAAASLIPGVAATATDQSAAAAVGAATAAAVSGAMTNGASAPTVVLPGAAPGAPAAASYSPAGAAQTVTGTAGTAVPIGLTSNGLPSTGLAPVVTTPAQPSVTTVGNAGPSVVAPSVTAQDPVAPSAASAAAAAPGVGNPVPGSTSAQPVMPAATPAASTTSSILPQGTPAPAPVPVTGSGQLAPAPDAAGAFKSAGSPAQPISLLPPASASGSGSGDGTTKKRSAAPSAGQGAESTTQGAATGQSAPSSGGSPPSATH